MRLPSVIRALERYARVVARSGLDGAPLRCPGLVQTVAVGAVVLLLLAGCGGDGDEDHVPEDDFLVSFPSPIEIFIRRPFDRPFEVLEIGVSPFIDPVFGPEAYVLTASGIAFLDGAEIFFEAEDVASIAFIDPLHERVIDVLIACDCFVDYVILLSSFGETIITFD